MRKPRPYQAKTITGAQAEVRRLRIQVRSLLDDYDRAWVHSVNAHTVAAALLHGVATWDAKTREWCFDGMRYSVPVGPTGVPKLDAALQKQVKAAIDRAMRQANGGGA